MGIPIGIKKLKNGLKNSDFLLFWVGDFSIKLWGNFRLTNTDVRFGDAILAWGYYDLCSICGVINVVGSLLLACFVRS